MGRHLRVCRKNQATKNKETRIHPCKFCKLKYTEKASAKRHENLKICQKKSFDRDGDDEDQN